jgi:hypothetical protein
VPLLENLDQTRAFRADQEAAAWMLHANLYMNAKVYTGTEQYTRQPDYKITGSTYIDFLTNYNQLFFADNDKNGAQTEFIFAVTFDGLRTQTFGGTTFLTQYLLWKYEKAAIWY